WNFCSKRRGTAAGCGASCGRTWPAIPITSFDIRRPSRGRVGIRASIWPCGRAGFDHQLTTGGRAVSIRVERDPLEVLKLGTYVGSCLGLGGSFASSAAAVVLDINKQVLYARDDRNAVLARQLVAISDDDQLVPFSVYPLSTPLVLLRAFREVDRQLAAALAIEQVSADQRYSIENILSREWWDDGAWPDDRDATDDGQTPRALTPRSCSADTR